MSTTATTMEATIDTPGTTPAEGHGKPPAHRPLLPHHEKYFADRGVSLETVRAAEIYSETNYLEIAAILNWRKYNRKQGPAIVIPYRDKTGAVVLHRIRPDRRATRRGKPGPKFLSPTGSTVRAFIPRNMYDALADVQRSLIVTEKEVAALAAWQRGFATVGLSGVDCWHRKKSSALIADLARIPWKGREVYIAFDSDAVNNTNVKDNECLLAEALKNHGATVKVVRLPGGPDGETVGLDDFLATNDADELRKLILAAEEPEPPDPGDVKENASKLDPALEASIFLKGSEVDGVFRLRFWRDSFYWWKCGRYSERRPTEIKAHIIQQLNADYVKLTVAIVNNVIMQLQAQSLLPFDTNQPAWLSEPGPWPAGEVLVTRNGLIHLPSLIAGGDYLLKPTPRFFTSTALDYDFAIDAPKPADWLAFLSQLWPNDTQSVETLQDIFGYALTPDTTQHKIFMLIGPKRSGKGTIARVLTAIIGNENVAGPTLASLATNFGLWPLLGKTLAIISDARLGGRTDSSIVVERLLSISGEDMLTVDRKNQEPVSGKLNARLMLLSNELPRLGDTSGALASRMILLRLTASFYGREDRQLTEKLVAERPGILLWAIEGWRRLHERGHFVQPNSGLELMGELCDLSSPIGAFTKERCYLSAGVNVPRADLYAAYRAWCEVKGRKHVEDEGGFGRGLRAAVPTLGSSQHRIAGKPTRFYEGIGLREIDSFGGQAQQGETCFTP